MSPSTIILLFSLLFVCLLSVGCGVIVAKRQTPPISEESKGFTVTRFDEAVQRFNKKRRFSKYPVNATLFVGSSTITRWSSLSKDLSPYPVINHGFGGSTLIEINHYFDEVITKVQPSLIFLYAGENDLGMGKSVEETHQELLTFLNKCEQKVPHAEIVYLAMKPSPSLD